MKWVLFLVGGAGLLTGAGCSSWQNPQPYAYYPSGYGQPAVAAPTYAQPTVAAPTYAPQAVAAPAYAPQYYAQPAAPGVATAPPTVQPVIYQQPQQACVPCVPCQ